MIIIEKSIGLKFEKLLHLCTAEVYYSETIDIDTSHHDVMLFTQCATQLHGAGSEYLTQFIELCRPQLDIFNAFNRETQYEIRRCEKADSLVFDVNSNPGSQDVVAFISFYHRFHQGKNLPNTETSCAFYLKTLYQFQEHNALVITSVMKQDQEPLCVHTYLVDGVRARLINSASVFRGTDSGFRSLVGRANRCLHWRDMLYFKGQGYKLYDLGGLSTEVDDTVSSFKRSFGGYQVTEYFNIYKSMTIKGKLALWVERNCKIFQTYISRLH